MKAPRHGHDGGGQGKNSLTHLYHLAQLDAQRPGNKGGWLKVLEMLMGRPDFRPATGGRA